MVFELFKKSNAYCAFVKDIKSGKVAHAYLLESSDESFLRDYLKMLASAIFKFDDKSRENKLVLEEKFTDLEIYPNTQIKTLGVEFAKEVTEKSFLSPLETDFKIVIVDTAQTMTPAAQNKLLKILEEPPKHLIFLFGTTKSQKLLSTLNSRLKKIKLEPFSVQEIEKALQGVDFLKEVSQTAAAISDGSIGLALAAAKYQDFTEIIKVSLEIVLGKLSVENAGDYMRAFSGFSDNVPLALAVLKTFFKDLLLTHLNESNLITNKTYIKDFKKGATVYPKGAIINAIDVINAVEVAISYNANISMQLEKLFLEILKGKHKWQKL